MINRADAFVLFDDTQYTRRDWRNRNRLKTLHGAKWITIPVNSKGKYTQRICDTTVSDPAWPAKHWELIRQAYARAPYFEHYRETFEPLYLECDEQYLSEINHRFLAAISGVLGIATPLSWSTDYEKTDGKNERLISICRQLGAQAYLSGPSAKGYISEQMFADAGIRVEWMDYAGYPEYRQAYPPFTHEVSMLDLIFNEGPNATMFMKSFG